MTDRPLDDVLTSEAAELLRGAEIRLASEASMLRRLNDVSLRLWRAGSLHEGLLEMLSAVIELLGADKGNVQLLDASRQVLTIAAQQGFEQPFLEFFREVSAEVDSASGRALRFGQRIVIEDVEADEGFRPFRRHAAEAGFRAVQSTPIIGSDGKPLGVLSAHFAEKHRPSEQELDSLDLYVRQAAYFIERCRMEEMVREREARLQAILDHAPDPVFIKDRDGRYMFINAHCAKVVGVDHMRALHKTDAELFEPALAQQFRRNDELVWSSGQGTLVDEEVPESDGTHTYLAHKFLLHDVRGTPYALCGIARDITDRKRAEAALRESEERTRFVTERARVGHWDWEIESDRLEWSPLCKQLFGIPEQETMSYSRFLEALHPEDREYTDRAVRACFESEGKRDFNMEYRTVWPSGEVRWIQAKGNATFENNRPVRMAGIVLDITARKQMEATLRESEQRYRGVFQHAGTGIAIKDTRGRFLSCNPAFTKMLGYSEEELLQLDLLSLVHPDDRDADMAAIKRLVAEEIPDCELLSRYVGKGGQAIWVNKHVSLIRDESGRPANIVALVTDMTERKQSEEHIQLLLREVTHRSKNLLTLVQAVARQTVAASPEDFLKRFDERIQALAASQDLLVKHGWKGAELEQLIRFQLSPFKDLFASRIRLDGPSVLISASAAQALGMAIHELATNANKYGALSRPSGRVDVCWHFTDGDDGEQRFVLSWSEAAGPPVAKPVRRGFGSKVICHLIECSLNGRVELDYAPSGLFWRLTCSAKELVDGNLSQVMATRVPSASPSRGRILVVEDDPLAAAEVAQVLTDAGFDVVGPTKDVAEALSLLNRDGCSAAVLDINLGHETSEPIATELAKRRTPFVTLSGYSRAQQGDVFDGAPALAKPLRPELLIATITQCLADGVDDQ